MVYIKWCKFSQRKLRLIVKCFVTDITATACAEISSVNRKSINRLYNIFREFIFQDEFQSRKQFSISTESELDESYFGPTRVKGKRGRGAGGKTIVFGMLKRKGQVYLKVIDRATKEVVLPVILRKITPGADIYTDKWKSYDALALYGYDHYKVDHGNNEFVRDHMYHVNGIESCWSFIKRRLAKFNGITKRYFMKHLIESEWRYNHRCQLENRLLILIKKAYS
ncbi:IS1595 family transposase [Candidatus Roizmanbacteria bacterium CG10_big_fil_rev_8_21_14_0_10_39_6]|uniref:IS1595 family transposase n=1 Tax=Candidatus Roizmanbacteria bacterium CG10_big_fil_rev_8_21_14_0_10_39_6 TaxID=1974853 RepID=A0A2M8KSL2_9BACT|nr:MAG: IS1595 family transposase [Candidatus Roizmanbacteria bacterium CG10_big_fil_rev_8_21_14_0_10_39_6]